MGIQTLSQQLLAFLAPFLPYPLNLGEKAAEEAGEKLGAEAWEGAKALWGKLQPKVEAKLTFTPTDAARVGGDKKVVHLCYEMRNRYNGEQNATISG